MLRWIVVLLILTSLFRRPMVGGFPFLSGWGCRRPPMGRRRYPPMGGPHGRGGGLGSGPHGGRF